jgi:hypothetical protein
MKTRMNKDGSISHIANGQEVARTIYGPKPPPFTGPWNIEDGEGRVLAGPFATYAEAREARPKGQTSVVRKAAAA